MKFSDAHRGQRVEDAYYVPSEWKILVMSEGQIPGFL